MASSEGQTELLTGWSCVVHQPSEDPEPSELPSTVDITAFSAGLNVDTSVNTQDEASESESESESASNNSGSDGSGSCTQSDSSDTDSSSSSSTSRSPSPEFSVTSQPNGLRLTIATVRKSCSSPPPEKNCKSEKSTPDKTATEKPIVKSSNLSSSSDSPCTDSETDQESEKSVKSIVKVNSGNENAKSKNRALIEKKIEKKGIVKKEGISPKTCTKNKSKIKRKKMASLPASRSSTCSSSDSNDSDADSAMLASCSLQEIRQEDLAAILPDQQECDAFGAFEEEERNSPQTGDASGSDMELPQQALNALIQRTTESSSESESHPPPNPNTLYANSLIQQFVSQPQMLNASTGNGSSGNSGTSGDGKSGNLENQETIKRKRGRPRKIPRSKTIVKKAEFCGDPNVSPDSGIQNSPDHVSSPECSPAPIIKRHHENKQKNLEKPENKQRSIERQETKQKIKINKHKSIDKLENKQKSIENKVRSSEKAKTSDLPKNKNSTNNNDDKNKEHTKIAVTSNRFDRILYGNGDRVLYPPRRKAGRPPLQRKGPGRPPKHKSIRTDSNTSGIKSKSKAENKSHKSKKVIPSKDKDNIIVNTNKENKTNKSIYLNEICERVSKRLELNKSSDKNLSKEEDNQIKLKSNNLLNRVILGNKNKVIKSKSFTLKAAKLMHSRHKHKKHKKCKFKIFKSISSIIVDPKLNIEIDKLVQDFEKFCIIDTSKMAKENVPEMLKALKKVSKKRKTSDYLDRKKKKQNIVNTVAKEPSSNNEQRLPLKKRHYHLSNNDTKPDSPKVENEDETETRNKANKVFSDKKMEIPLNLLPKPTNKSFPSPRNNNNNDYEVKNVDSHITEAIEACINKYSINDKKIIKTEDKQNKHEIKIALPHITATTPKKRHRLEQISEKSETTEVNNKDISLENVVTELKFKRNLTSKLECKKPDNIQINTRKKNRLEDLTSTLASKMNPNEDLINKRKKELKNEERATVIKYPICKKAKPIEPSKLDLVVEEKPTGIFMPTVDLELLIKETKVEVSIVKTEVTKELIIIDKEKPKAVEFKKKGKKRRAFNRTGFPTVKKKKKKVPIEQIIEVKVTPCDRVPEVGEEYSQFVERTKNENNESNELLSVSKWEVMSECDSLPQDERIDFDSLEIKSDRMSLRNKDYSPANREDTPDTKESDLDDISLDSRMELSKKGSQCKRKREILERKCNENVQKKIRDISPASSIDPCLEKRLKEDRASASSDDSRKTKKNPRWRKKYLIAGLFSDYFKEGDVKVQQKRKEFITSKTKLIYNSSEHPFGLFPAPYHCGKNLRRRKIPFELPFDLWWQHTHSQLPGRDAVPSWNYKKIRTNVYNVKNTTGACEPQSCNCSTHAGCGDDCINRLVLSECPAAHKCKNQKIQKHEWAPGIEKFMTENKGWGVKTNLSIKSGEFILEYVGEVVSDQEFKERMATRYIYDTHHYCLHLDGGLVIDGHRMGGEGRFVNHSCEPNCEMQKWTVNGQFRMALFALRNIKEGEELTYDYNFSLFNATEGQECKCGNDNCRGVIGGKSQRIRQATNVLPPSQPGRVGRPRKNQAKKAPSKGIKEVQAQHSQNLSVSNTPQFKPLSHAQRVLILDRHVFLLRNIKRIKKNKDKSLPNEQLPISTSTLSKTFQNHLNSLRLPRNIKTRRLAQAEEDPELKKTLILSNTLKDIFKVLLDAKDDDEKLSLPFITCPSKRKVPEYYQKVSDPIDLTMIENKIDTGIYKTFESFDSDINKLFTNVTKVNSRSSDIGVNGIKLKKIYDVVKKESRTKLEHAVISKTTPKLFGGRKKCEEEDIIRCICGMHKDEGLMIQCERCFVWQHCECIQADVNAPSYHCEKCVPREVDYEISLDDYTEHGHQYYMTLMRDDLQLRQGDTVYVLRDIPIPGTDKKHTYDTIGEINYTDLDIFRIERLWKDCKTGKRFAYGHHFLRPHETYHEPTRKFFPNEVMRVPLYEAVPVELIISHCWVMDLNTFCKGKPIGAPKEHIYICEYRVDKGARLFSKVSKSKLPICTKSYAFDRYETRLKISRTYTPHDLDPAFVKQRGRKPQDTDEIKEVVPEVPVVIVRTLAEQKLRLNNILLNLLSKQPTKNVLDVSYLLEGGRRRKKQN